MTKTSLSRFDPGELAALAGDRAFARGEAYHRDGQVSILSLTADRVLAQVAGTEDYRVTLSGRGRAIGGSCTCRAFEDYGFCKHMVATALAANEAAANGQADGADSLGRIRAHLKTKSVDALVDLIVDMAERGPALFRKLDLAAAIVHTDDKAFEARLRKAIDVATRIRGFIEYADVSRWAKGVNEALDILADMAAGPHAARVRALAEHAMDRIEKAMESIDDSDGHCGALLSQTRDIHLAACAAAPPEPIGLARCLFGRETRDAYDMFYGAAGLYEGVLGEPGLAEYRRLAEAAWRKLPVRTGRKKPAMDDDESDPDRLMAILDFFAEREGDIDARIALRARDLSSPWRHLQLAQFCLDQGREDEALRRAEEGLWIFEDDGPDQRLTLFLVDLLSRKGRKEEAAAHLWRIFEKSPSLDLYQRLAKLAGSGACERAVGFLEAQSASGKRGARGRWGWNGPQEVLIAILTHEKAFDRAWAVVQERGASVEAQEGLADASKGSHPREALGVYAARVEEHVGGGRYEEAAKLVARMGKLRDAAEQAAYVADIKDRHRRKRNFMKLLKP
ncbi:MAG: SWIM zinc finger family protein [Bradyrhizobium sp.]